MKEKKTKPKMGRPPKCPDEKQDKCVMVRLTRGEYARLVSEAKRVGMPKAVFLVHCWKQQRG